MGDILVPQDKTKILSAVLIRGDLANLSEEEKLGHLKSVCESLGLNHLTHPFKYISMNGKLVLYAGRDATDQLRKLHNVSLEIVNREKIDDCYIVTARAKIGPSGRIDESVGAVFLGGLRGDALANAYMKAETKAKRRVTLSICGLGLLDETEVESVHRNEGVNQVVPSLPNASKETVSTVFKKLREELYILADKYHWTNDAMKKLIKQRYQKESTLDLIVGELEDLIEFLNTSSQFIK